MMDQIARDIAAIVIVIMGSWVAWMEIEAFRACRWSYRWIYLVKAFAGVLCAILFAMALLRLFSGGSDIVDPVLGRPVFIITLLALALGAIHHKKITGGC
jgi:hypothetical protein